MVTVTADASDNISVNRVEFYVDSILAATDFDSPYSFAWNSLALSDGIHSIATTAFDDAGNNSSSTVALTVDNVCDPDEPFIFATFADNYSGHESGLRRTFDELRQKGVRFAVSAGDTAPYDRIRGLMDAGLNSMQPCGASEFPWYPGAGNHDVEEIDEMSAWASIWAVDWDNNAANTRLASQLPGLTNFKRGPLQVGGQAGPVNIQPGTIYSFDYGNAHFLFVNEYEQGIISDLFAGIGTTMARLFSTPRRRSWIGSRRTWNPPTKMRDLSLATWLLQRQFILSLTIHRLAGVSTTGTSSRPAWSSS